MICEVGEDKIPTRFAWRASEKNYTVVLKSRQEWDRLVDVLDPLFDQKKVTVLTDDAKKLAHALLLAGCLTEQVKFDVVLSDYLLQPEGGDHDLARVAES